MRSKKKILLVGLNPKLVESPLPDDSLDEATLSAALDAGVRSLREAGYDARWLLTDRGETAVAAVTTQLREETFDCVLIDAGLRGVESLLIVFEKLVNVIHVNAPEARLAFNTSPADTLRAVQRWV